jgi:hypothetical protein
MDLTEIEYEHLDWISRAQRRNDDVKTIMNVWVQWGLGGYFL